MRTKVELPGRLCLVAAAAWAVLVAPFPASANEATFRVSLSGPEVSGDPDGRGEATVTLDPETTEIDVQLTYSRIAEPTSIHIRRGATGSEGNIVASFFIENEGRGRLAATGTVRADHVQQMLSSPEDYYLVVLNREHVVGALRGPLQK